MDVKCEAIKIHLLAIENTEENSSSDTRKPFPGNKWYNDHSALNLHESWCGRTCYTERERERERERVFKVVWTSRVKVGVG